MQPMDRLADVIRDSSLAVLLHLPPSDVIVAASPAAEQLLGARAGDAAGRPVGAFVSGEPSGALPLIARGRLRTYETRRELRSTGEMLRVWVRGVDCGAQLCAVVVLLPEGATTASTFADLADDSSPEALPLRESLDRFAVDIRTAVAVDVPVTRAALLDGLAEREREVVRELLQGNRVPAIAGKLFLSQGTVRNHLSAAFRKLGVANQQELIDLLRR
jgi:DNA-binding CsgD family transcriptional regulator